MPKCSPPRIGWPDFDGKLSVYLRQGLRHVVLVDVNQDETMVGIRWLRAEDDRWVEMASVAGTTILSVNDPFVFQVVPTDLLPW